jgi:cell division protein FtsB
VALFAERGYLDWRRMVTRTAHVTKQLELVQSEIAALEREMKAIESDVVVQERLVRSQLGYIRDGESVVDLD